jgi:hypothetical protein
MPPIEHTYKNPSAFSSFLHQKIGCRLLKDLASTFRSLCSAGVLAVRVFSNDQRVPFVRMSPLIKTHQRFSPILEISDHRTTKQWICSLVVIQRDMGELVSMGMCVGYFPPRFGCCSPRYGWVVVHRDVDCWKGLRGIELAQTFFSPYHKYQYSNYS